MSQFFDYMQLYGVYWILDFTRCMEAQCSRNLVSFYAFMLMSVPMLHFIQNTVSKENQWIPEILDFTFIWECDRDRAW